ncbi:hypothetical protein AFV9_gp28 [Betalipothrixvirus uzonense]|uniref:Uncharacterized protein n=1 Tax=Betalipothrixvirus uzonense TaxID=512792 RepID=B2CRK5_9VIRU|nr:hypothetical protein AFV9_gp28 [Acidianus filamentous virus 9]ACB37262.1 hypothetical protein [Acidianus filamentous virus 9]
MLIAQVVKKGWYIDFKVDKLDDIPARYIPYIRSIGEEKYGTNSVCYIIIRLRRVEPPAFRGSNWLLTAGREEGERVDKGNRGGVGRPASGFIRHSGFGIADGRGDMVWWCSGVQNNVVSPIPGRRGRIYMVDVRQILKIDIDVSVNYYDPNWLLEKKSQQLRALGYDYDDAWWEYSPSGKHIHILIILKDPVTVKELFDLQFLLGDDPKRVEFNYLRYSVMGEDAIHFNVLYTYKKKLSLKDKIRTIIRHYF